MKKLSLIFLGVGIFLLIQVLLPTVYFKFWELTNLTGQNILIDPSAKTNVLGVSVENIGNFPAFVSKLETTDAPYKEFSLTVPKIKLEKIPVKVYSNDFEHSLASLPGTGLPGEVGNTFVSGHSSLPQFYSPTNFQAIFSNLPELKKEDSIEVDVLGQHFEYKVEGIRVVDPSETWVINPPDNIGRYLTLMTCVPPGFNTKRLVVLSKLRE